MSHPLEHPCVYINNIYFSSLTNIWQNDLCSFHGKPFNITVIQAYAPTSNAEEAEVEPLYEDLQDLSELTPKKDFLLIIGDWNAEVGSQKTPGVTGKQISLEHTKWIAFQFG